MKLKTFLIGVALFGVIPGALIVRSQITPPASQSFVLTQVTTSPTKDAQGIHGVISQLIGIAVRADGSIVKFSYPQAAGNTAAVRKIFDLQTGVEAVVEPMSESISTTKLDLASWDLHPIKPAITCGYPPAGQVLGYSVEYSNVEKPIFNGETGEHQHATHIIQEDWYAPSLGCVSMNSRTRMQTWIADTTNPNGGSWFLQADTTRTGLSVVIGPVDDYFAIPTNYVERNFTDVFMELNRRYPGEFPVPTPGKHASQDAAYAKGHAALLGQ